MEASPGPLLDPIELFGLPLKSPSEAQVFFLEARREQGRVQPLSALQSSSRTVGRGVWALVKPLVMESEPLPFPLVLHQRDGGVEKNL